jgi:AraC family transcriptional regulator
MADDACTLGFGVTFDMVAARTACGQLLTLTSHRSDDEIPPHRHVNDYVCIVLGGGFAEQEGNRTRERRSGCVFTHHAGETHHDRFGPRGAMCVNLHYPAGESGLAIEGSCSASTQVAAQRLAYELAASSREELAMASLAAEIMGDLQPGSSAADGGKWIDRLVEAISDEPHRRWSLRELAEIAERHPVHIAQAFRARTGVSLGAFQRLRRLTCLSLALRRADTPLAALAAEFGYCDQSHMNSEFRAAFGVSPGRYRRELH